MCTNFIVLNKILSDIKIYSKKLGNIILFEKDNP